MEWDSANPTDHDLYDMLIRSFCQSNGISVDSVASSFLTQNVSSCLNKIVYVASQIQKKCRRKTLTASDISKSIEICGFESCLLFPTDSSVYQAFLDVSKKSSDSVCLDLEPAVGLMLATTPVKKFNLVFDWALVNGVEGSVIENAEPSQLAKVDSKDIDYLLKYYLEADESYFAKFLGSLEEPLSTHDKYGTYLSFISSEILRVLCEIPPNISFLLDRLLRITRSILRNTSYVSIFYNGILLPSLFSVLFSDNLGTSSRDDHWSLRDLAAQCITLMYNSNVRLGGNGDKAITETIFYQFQRNSLSDIYMYGCLSCIFLLGGDTAVVFLKRYLSKHFSKNSYTWDGHVRNKLLSILQLFDFSNNRVGLEDSVVRVAKDLIYSH